MRLISPGLGFFLLKASTAAMCAIFRTSREANIKRRMSWEKQGASITTKGTEGSLLYRVEVSCGSELRIKSAGLKGGPFE